jgi:Zn-dependent peptidase ImmA (M78 family)
LRNAFLKDRTAQDIDHQVGKVLRDLGSPEPPLKIEDVRELLRLDRQYYSSSDDGILREVAHRLKVAGKQLIKRPSLLVDVVKKWDLKALYLPDSKRILIDQDLHELKQRWGEAHEIGHDIIPWHQGLMLGDTKATLRPACHAQLESEANYAAGRLLFLQDQFREHVGGEPDLKAIRKLARAFGNSITTALWRVVECLDVPAVAAVTVHPHRQGEDFDATKPCKYFIRSRRFEAEFGRIDELTMFAVVGEYCENKRGGPLGSADVILSDDRGEEHVFSFETFFNRYEALSLGLYRGKRKPVIRSA